MQALRLAALLLFCAGAAAAKGTSYDILYLRSGDLPGINAAKASVAHILGPDVARRLRVVRADGRYAVIYERRGDLGSAAAVARAHARMLAPHGLQAPVPVKAGGWAAAPPAAPARPPAAKRPAAPAVRTAAADADKDLPFEARIDKYLKDLRRTGGVKKDESTAWAIYDLADDTKLAGINEDVLLQSASLLKPFIALAYFHEVAQGRQQYTDAAKKHLEEMIRDSDNAAADWFMRLLGGPAGVQQLLSHNYGNILRDLLLVEYIPRNGHTYRNKASVRDYTAFLHALWNDKLPSSAEIKRVMNLPKRNRLYSGAHGMPQTTEVYDKTGTTCHLCGDMGILVALRKDGKRFPYIVIGLIQKTGAASRYFRWMRTRGDIIRHISGMAYAEMALRHNFGAFNAEAAGPAPDAAGRDQEVPVSTAAAASAAVFTSTAAPAPAAAAQPEQAPAL